MKHHESTILRCIKPSLCLLMICFALPLTSRAGERKSAPAPTLSPQQEAALQQERADLFSSENYGATLSAQPINGDTVYALCFEGGFQFSSGFAGTDCWGYIAPDGTEYAMMGIFDGVVFVDVTNMRIVDTVPQEPCGWRDMATAGSYCYSVMDCGGLNGGIMVMDLQYLPDSVHLVRTVQTNDPNHGFFMDASHNLAIDSVAGFLYVEGWCGCQGWQNTNIFVHDISDPANPVYVTSFSNKAGDIHDMWAYNDTVWVADGGTSSFTVWDLSNKLNPQIITTWTSFSGGYAHNIWLNDDRTIAVTTEETPGRTVKIWDVSDLTNVQLLGQYLGPSGLAHNAHIKGDKLYLSHYESGLRIVDISDPTNPVEIGAYDTHPGESANFEGAWGVYPHSPNDYIFVSNMDERLIILKEKLEVISDTMFIDTAGAVAGNDVRVDVMVTNSQETHQIVIPFTWAGPANLTFDSVSTVGLRTDYFAEVNVITFNPFGKEGAYALVSSPDGSLPDLAPGSGPVLSLWFSVPGGASCGLSPVDFKQVNGTNPTISDACGIAISPDFFSGAVNVCGSGSNCCAVAGDADHSGSLNIGDVTFIIARIFSGGPAPFCPQEADADASGSLNIADASYLIARIFGGGPAPVCGP